MGQREAEDKPTRRRWSRRNLLWEDAFEYFGHMGGDLGKGAGRGVARKIFPKQWAYMAALAALKIQVQVQVRIGRKNTFPTPRLRPAAVGPAARIYP